MMPQFVHQVQALLGRWEGGKGKKGRGIGQGEQILGSREQAPGPKKKVGQDPQEQLLGSLSWTVVPCHCIG